MSGSSEFLKETNIVVRQILDDVLFRDSDHLKKNLPHLKMVQNFKPRIKKFKNRDARTEIANSDVSGNSIPHIDIS